MYLGEILVALGRRSPHWKGLHRLIQGLVGVVIGAQHHTKCVDQTACIPLRICLTRMTSLSVPDALLRFRNAVCAPVYHAQRSKHLEH